MNPRYFVTSKRLTESSVEQSTFAFGRFSSLDDAEASAKKNYGCYGSEVLAVRAETPVEAVGYKISRLLVRSLRVTFGVSIAVLGFIFLWEPAPGIGNVPIASLTLDMIFNGLFRGVLLMGSAWLAWAIAFGEGPDAKQ